MSNSIKQDIGLKEKQVKKLKALYQENPDEWALKYAESLAELSEMHLEANPPKKIKLPVVHLG